MTGMFKKKPCLGVALYIHPMLAGSSRIKKLKLLKNL